MTDPRLRTAAVVLALLGAAVAGYLTYVHYAGVEPVCVGGGGGCALVQASEQSELAGVPVALLGLLSYLGALVALLAGTGERSRIAVAFVALVGFGFSVYLTIQSLTVIDATCQWCLASLAIMTLLAGVSVTRLLRA